LNLEKELRMISSKTLANSHRFPPQFKEKLEFLVAAHGTFAIAREFQEWCDARRSEKIQYPIIEFMKEVDSIFGGAPEQLDLKDPRILEISALVFERTDILPSHKAVAELLQTYSMEELTGAIREYTDKIEDGQARSAMRRFFAEGGAGAVILARRQRAAAGIKI
jgi:hypothetical protein